MADYLKIPEVAQLLGLSEKTVRRRVKAGEIPSVFIGGVYRIPRADLNEYLQLAKVRPGKVSVPPSQPSLYNHLAEERRSQHPRIAARALFLETDRERWEQELETGVVSFESGDVTLDTPAAREACELMVFSEKLRHVTELAELGILDEVLDVLEEISDPAGVFCRELVKVAAFRAPEERAIVSGLMQALERKLRDTETSGLMKRIRERDQHDREARSTDEQSREIG